MLYQQVIISSSGERSTTSEPELLQSDYALLAPQVSEEELTALRNMMMQLSEAVHHAVKNELTQPEIDWYQEGFAQARRQLTKALVAPEAH